MMDWMIPKTINNLQGFLGMAGYYHKFVKNYWGITAPLTSLLKKDSFSWTLEESKKFQQLKEAMCKYLVLVTLDFTKTLIVQCDFSRNRNVVVLMQYRNPLSFTSHPIKGNNLKNPIYEK